MFTWKKREIKSWRFKSAFECKCANMWRTYKLEIRLNFKFGFWSISIRCISNFSLFEHVCRRFFENFPFYLLHSPIDHYIYITKFLEKTNQKRKQVTAMVVVTLCSFISLAFPLYRVRTFQPPITPNCLLSCLLIALEDSIISPAVRSPQRDKAEGTRDLQHDASSVRLFRHEFQNGDDDDR